MPKEPDQDRMLRHAATGMYAGIQFIVTFLLFLAAGYFADRQLGTAPGFMANGVVVGFLVALWRLNRQGRRIMADGKAEADEDAKEDAAAPEEPAADEGGAAEDNGPKGSAWPGKEA